MQCEWCDNVDPRSQQVKVEVKYTVRKDTPQEKTVVRTIYICHSCEGDCFDVRYLTDTSSEASG